MMRRRERGFESREMREIGHGGESEMEKRSSERYGEICYLESIASSRAVPVPFLKVWLVNWISISLSVKGKNNS